MKDPYIFNFKRDISAIDIPSTLNNPFGSLIPTIAQIAAEEFQDFISEETYKWDHDFKKDKGKMFGVLVVQHQNNSFGYLGTVSGKLKGQSICSTFVPSLFDDSTDDYFINKGMSELTKLSATIKSTTNPSEISSLKERRKQKSKALQFQLFENYHFLNRLKTKKNVLEIFKDGSLGIPPAATGECAAPKLLHYAFENNLTPIAIAEFWWGLPKNNDRKAKMFYPACKNKCKPILEFMLMDKTLFDRAQS